MTPRPSVLIVGGFATAPPLYRPFRDRLSSREVERVDIASIWPPDWAIASVLGFGPLLRRVGRQIERTFLLGGRRPIIVVGHSGGGIAARLAMSHVPFHGRVAGAAEAVGCLVTLGTPHSLHEAPKRFWHAGHEASEFLALETPGAFYAPRTGYLNVGSNYSNAAFPGLLGRLADELFSVIVGPDTRGPGDGIVPAPAVRLEGAEQIMFDDVVHGMIGTPWYGDEAIIDRWWPDALRLWREALAARAAGRPATGPRDPARAIELEESVEQAAVEVEAAMAGQRPEFGH